jgi:hypothetical protein
VSEITGREVLLDKAKGLVMGDRNKVYDDPIDNFGRIVDLWNPYLEAIFGEREVQPHDVAILNILQKIARIAHTPDHADSWVDIAGYAACGWDCVVAESLEETEWEPTGEEAPLDVVKVLSKFRYSNMDIYVVSEAMFLDGENREEVERWLLANNQVVEETSSLFDTEYVGTWVVRHNWGNKAHSLTWGWTPDRFSETFEVVRG